jgi:molecular chaperone GrpE
MSTPPQTDPSVSSPDPAGDALQAEVERLTAELGASQAKAQEHWETYLRSLAETDNVRKRAQREVETAHKYAVERFAGDLLDARDSLELGIAAGPGVE